nr:hypothetical protein [Tanacetum cinerariifolium]
MTESEGDKDGSSVIDFSSPYYLHPSDSPKQPSVNKMLTDRNYNDWARKMTNFLFAKNKTDFVDGTLKKPETSTSEYKSWMRCDAMIKGWLTTTMEKDIRDSVEYANTSSEIWLLWDESHSIISFPCCSCNKCTCELGKKITAHLEKQKLYEFLMGLDSDFNVIRTQVLATKPVPTIGTAYHMVAEDERQRAISLENQAVPEPAAFKAFQRRDNNFRSSKEKYMAKQEKENKQNDECTFCKKIDHKRKRVFQTSWLPRLVAREERRQAKPKVAYVETGTSPIPGLMRGSSKSLSSFLPVRVITLKQNLRPTWQGTSNEALVVIPNGHAIPVEGKGFRTRSLIESGKCQGGLYLMDMFEKGRRAMMTTTYTWHKRLGHASRDKLSNKIFPSRTSHEALIATKDEPTKVHDDFKSTNFFLDSGEQNCFYGPPQNPSSTITEDIGSEEENVAQHENDLFENNSPVLVPEIKEDHAISHEEPKPRSKRDEKWRNAMQQKIKALEKNRTWTLEELPEGKRPIDSKWVYKAKFKSNGEVERYKARLITKGCTQREGVDYHEIFAPVAKLVTVRTLLAVATKKGWIIHQLDVNNAFLHGDLDEEDSGMLGCRPSAFPFEQGTKLDKGEEETQVDATQYRRLVGRLLYLKATRPDVTYAVNVLSQFVSDPRQNHLEAAKRVLRYLKGTPGQGILLPREGPTTLTAYCDSDWLGFPFTRRPRIGYLLLFSGGPISWKTKKQSVVSRSSK